MIKKESRQDYIQTLKDADNGSLEPFIKFITLELNKTQEDIIKDIELYLA